MRLKLSTFTSLLLMIRVALSSTVARVVLELTYGIRAKDHDDEVNISIHS